MTNIIDERPDVAAIITRDRIRHERAVIGALTRSRSHDDPDLVAARKRLAHLHREQRVQEIIADWPELTTEQVARIAGLLSGAP